ncbi:MAG: para-aminobenzoate synthetase component 1 [Candidatus Krumholzibacteriia bacterium]|jgi:para-aminobenzoate synthetase component 1
MFGHSLKTSISLNAPFWRCAEVFAQAECAFLLDSGMESGRAGRYSYLGGNPAALIRGWRTSDNNNTMRLEIQTWCDPDGRVYREPKVRQFVAEPFEALREIQAEYRLSAPEANAPFSAGLVGYFGYETAHAIESLPDTGQDDLQLPDFAFMVIDEVLVFDHHTEQATLHVKGRGPDAKTIAESRAQWWRNGLAKPKLSEAKLGNIRTDSRVRAHFTRQQYMAAVDRCREHILAGDVFEVCLTHRLEMDFAGSAWELFMSLRKINPAPFASYLQFPDFKVVSASPESFLNLDTQHNVESRPIKGTRPRARDKSEDAAIIEELRSAEKDRAENIMIVDLVRNDLGRVCEIGSVRVPEMLTVETYATVHQLVSTVQGKLKSEFDAFDLVRACFPGGSMTGAPKIEAMKIIDSIEPVKRGVYSGAIGFIDHSGAMDLGMVIRTIICRDGVATFGVGGAIVSDSDPGAEYDETMDKARALIAAIESLNQDHANRGEN